MLARDRKTSAGGPRTVSSPVRPATEASRVPDDASLLKMLYYMKLTREIETRIERKLYRQGKIVGGVYVGRGQEAIAVGSTILLEKDDCICPSHRDMGAYLIRAMSPRVIFAQYMYRKTGAPSGKDAT